MLFDTLKIQGRTTGFWRKGERAGPVYNSCSRCNDTLVFTCENYIYALSFEAPLPWCDDLPESCAPVSMGDAPCIWLQTKTGRRLTLKAMNKSGQMCFLDDRDSSAVFANYSAILEDVYSAHLLRQPSCTFLEFLDEKARNRKKVPIAYKVLESVTLSRGGTQGLFDYTYTPITHIQNVPEALNRIQAAVQAGEPLCVVGDYDCDGLTSTAMLVRTLTDMGACDVRYFIPNRFEDAYGISPRIVQEIAGGLAILVDNGTSAVERIAELRAKGVEVIVIDHHTPGASLPRDCILVNPKVYNGKNGFTERCTAGLVGDMCIALAPSVNKCFLYALQALGTVADVVPLIRDNREIVQRGLAAYKHCGVPTLISLLSVTHCACVDEQAVAFKIAPCINAAGRLGSAQSVVEALTGRGDIADVLAEKNQARQDLERAAMSKYEGLPFDEDVAVIMDDSLHRGILGSIAGKLKSKLNKPAVVIAQGTGSARSTGNVRLYEALENRKEDFFERFGGHERGFGFTLKPGKAEDLRAYLSALKQSNAPPTQGYDIELDFDAVDLQLCKAIATLAPFGEGNPEPVFLSRNVRVNTERLVGADKNVLQLKLGTHGISAVYFGASLLGRKNIDILYTLRVDTYSGEKASAVLKGIL